MIRDWLIRLLQWLLGDQCPAPQSSSLAQLPLDATLEQYSQALDGLNDDSQMMLPTLLARDQIEAALRQTKPLPTGQIQRLVTLDARLRDQTVHVSLKDLSTWRQTIRPPDAHWWWILDQAAENQAAEKDLHWVVLAGTFSTFTIPLTMDIIKRLLVDAPDNFSIVGTLVTILLTGSPFSKRFRELVKRFLGSIRRIPLRFHAKIMAGMAGIAFLLLGSGWLLLPRLAVYYNNQGLAALQVGNLARAQHKFQRAVGVNADLVVPYYNLAEVYQRIARPDEAQEWYQKAIEHDLNFAPAYRGLGYLYNTQGEYEKAKKVLLVGLSYLSEEMKEKEATVTRHELLANLGWSYFAQERYERAQEALEAAIALEEELKHFEEIDGAQYRLALPHYYLAQIYELSERLADAYQQWEDCLRLLERGWEHQEWRATVREHLEKLEEELQ